MATVRSGERWLRCSVVLGRYLPRNLPVAPPIVFILVILQVMPEADAAKYRFNPFDVTKVGISTRLLGHCSGNVRFLTGVASQGLPDASSRSPGAQPQP